MKLNIDILEEFKKITSKDIDSFLRKCISFFKKEYLTIAAYYNGDLKEIESSNFTTFQLLKEECSEMLIAFQNNSRYFNNIKWWELLEYIEAVSSRFDTLNSIHKWSRSSLGKNSYSANLSVQYVSKQNQTLEKVSTDVLGLSEAEWYDIAIDNDLAEEDYSLEGGQDLRLKASQNIQKIEINSVVDVMVGKSIYGKDIKRQMQIVDNDIVTLDYDETILQSVDILISLKKGDNPMFPSMGLQSAVVIGSNRATLNFPIIARQLGEVFSSDDSLKNFSLKELKVEEDNLLIDYEVQTRLNETFDGQVSI